MGQFDDKGFNIVLSNLQLTVSKGKFAFTGLKTGPLYTCTLYNNKPLSTHSLNLVKALSIKVWHNHMGHLNWDAIKPTQSDNPPLLGVKFYATDPPHKTCPGCAAGKTKYHIFKLAGSHYTQSSYPIKCVRVARQHLNMSAPE